MPKYHETYRKCTVSVDEHIDYMKFYLESNLATSVKVKGHITHISLTLLYMHKLMFFSFIIDITKVSILLPPGQRWRRNEKVKRGMYM